MSDDLDMKRVIDRIRAFLNMAQSPNEAEAATAMEMAHRMLKEHNLTMSQIARETQGIKEDAYEHFVEMPVWKDQLLMQICKTFYCDSYRHHFTDINKWIIVGRPDNVATVRMMADYLLEAIDRWALKLAADTVEAEEAYKTGMADTLRVRLFKMMKQETVQATSSTALIRKETALVEQYMNKKMEEAGGTKDEAPELKVEDFQAYLKGLEDGEAVSLSKQLESSGLHPRDVAYLLRQED